MIPAYFQDAPFFMPSTIIPKPTEQSKPIQSTKIEPEPEPELIIPSDIIQGSATFKIQVPDIANEIAATSNALTPDASSDAIESEENEESAIALTAGFGVYLEIIG